MGIFEKKIRKHCILIFIILILFFSGCLPILHYPSRVCNTKSMYLGLGTSWVFRGSKLMPFYNSIFYRIGLPYEFDTGLDIFFHPFVPISIMSSLRKQFSFEDFILLDAVTVGIAYAPLIDNHIIISTSLIKKNTSFSFGVSIYQFSAKYNGEETYNHFFTQLNFDIQKDRIHLMPYIHFSTSWESDYDEFILDFRKYYESYTFDVKRPMLLIGTSIYWDIN